MKTYQLMINMLDGHNEKWITKRWSNDLEKIMQQTKGFEGLGFKVALYCEGQRIYPERG